MTRGDKIPNRPIGEAPQGIPRPIPPLPTETPKPLPRKSVADPVLTPPVKQEAMQPAGSTSVSVYFSKAETLDKLRALVDSTPNASISSVINQLVKGLLDRHAKLNPGERWVSMDGVKVYI